MNGLTLRLPEESNSSRRASARNIVPDPERGVDVADEEINEPLMAA